MTDEPEAPAAAPEPVPERVEHAVEAEASRVETTIAAWVAQHLHDSPVARATEAWNHIVSVLPHLIQALKEA